METIGYCEVEPPTQKRGKGDKKKWENTQKMFSLECCGATHVDEKEPRVIKDENGDAKYALHLSRLRYGNCI